jgi:hypothetical protein
MGETFSDPPPRNWGEFAVHARDVPFSAVLDEIAAKSGTYSWFAIQHRAGPCMIDLKP